MWKLHLSIPTTYPQQPPTANFRIPIFHPNVDPQTGGVCVETLKRDWDSKLTLRDVLVTISCLLIQPNPDSALNAEAGALIQDDYDAFARRAELMTSIHAGVPRGLSDAVKEAQNRGQEEQEDEPVSEAPVRRRRTIAKVRSNMRRSEASPTGQPAQRRQQAPPNRAFVFQSGNDDVFGTSTSRPQNGALSHIDEDDTEEEQENEVSKSPAKVSSPIPVMTPRRPHGVAVPLGELIMDHDDQDTSQEMEPEYPPSPQKSSSPHKSSPKRRQFRNYDTDERPESSRAAAIRGGAFNITPPNLGDKPLASDSPFMDITFENSPSPKKAVRRGLFDSPPKRPMGSKGLFGSDVAAPSNNMNSRRDVAVATTTTPHALRGILKPRSPNSADRRRQEDERRVALDAKLWKLCGGDIKRWNRGDFNGEPFKRVGGRW